MSNRAETIRNEIIFQTYGYRPQARDAERIARQCRHEGELSDVTPIEIEIEADYLVGKGLVESVKDELAKAHKRYRITAAGIDHAEQFGLV